MSKPAAVSTALCATMPIPAMDGASVPTHIHLLPAGEIRTVDGRGPYRVSDATALIAASMADGARLPLDENHSTDLAAPRGEAAPARGWIVGLQARDDGIWGEVEWTPYGRRLVATKAYRNISPAIAYRADGTVIGVLRASLVNRPNLRGLVALHQQEEQMDFLAKLRAKLGLNDDADEAAVMAALDAAMTNTATHAAQLAPIAKAVGLGDDADGGAILLAVQGLSDPSKMVPASALVALQSELATVVGGLSRDKAIAAVDAAIKAGKIAAPKVMREHYIARHMADPAAVDKELGAMISLHGATGARLTPPTLDEKGRPGLDGD
ncbi:MAG: phage protease, partial [Thermoleophilia bacterium]|nr:phage protease [Thermoleophilia bacterium]